jgi:hypothetical protein
VLGVLTGLALVLIVWGWVYVRSPGGAARPGPAGGEPITATSPTAQTRDRFERPDQLRLTDPDTSASAGPAPAAAAEPSAAAPPARATVTYEVAVRGEVSVDVEDFASQVARFLSDPLGWPAVGVAFERVDADAMVTIWLSEDSQVPSFSSICSTGLSCSIGRDVIINEKRWVESAPPGVMDDVPVEQYRMMVVNHEVGHWLGHHNHTSCAGPGELAPLMMQQSKGLHGCVFNPYPLPGELTAPDLFG